MFVTLLRVVFDYMTWLDAYHFNSRNANLYPIMILKLKYFAPYNSPGVETRGL